METRSASPSMARRARRSRSITISGNQVYSLKTGESESMNVDGNVTHFAITNNIVHDNDNIGIDAIGFEGVGPVGYDQAQYGEVSGNTVYNISGITNAGEGKSYDADGLYCDGCAYVIFERNTVYNCDLAMEAASEHKGHDASYVTIRNNVFYDANAVGVSIGGYSATRGRQRPRCRRQQHALQQQREEPGSGISDPAQRSGSSRETFSKTISSMRARRMSGSTASSAARRRPPRTGICTTRPRVTCKERRSTGAGKYNYETYAAYQSGSGEDANSPNANPLFANWGRRLRIWTCRRIAGDQCREHEPDLQRGILRQRHFDLRQHRLRGQSADQRQRADQYRGLRAVA